MSINQYEKNGRTLWKVYVSWGKRPPLGLPTTYGKSNP
jgi:hypothetical protein